MQALLNRANPYLALAVMLRAWLVSVLILWQSMSRWVSPRTLCLPLCADSTCAVPSASRLTSIQNVSKEQIVSDLLRVQ